MPLGPILFVTGLVLLSGDSFLSAWAYYEVYTSTSISFFQSIDLAFGAGEVLTAIGVLLAATGWVLGKRQSSPRRADSSPERTGSLLGVGHGVVLLGAVLIAGATAYLGTLDFAQYYNMPLNEPWWTSSLLYVVEGVGIVALAGGWLIHFSGSSREF